MPDLAETLRQRAARHVQKHGLRPVAREAGVAHPSLLRFIRGQLLLRLDGVSALAEVVGLELRPKRPRKRGKT